MVILNEESSSSQPAIPLPLRAVSIFPNLNSSNGHVFWNGQLGEPSAKLSCGLSQLTQACRLLWEWR
jgi:hypothetical protein